jgi:hypothetical protein
MKRAPRKGQRSRREPKPSLDAGSFNLLLAASETALACTLIPEPNLIFAGKHTCEDPKTGLLAFGPYSKTDATRRTEVRIGVVGPAEAIDRALNLVERMCAAIPHSDKLDALLHPSFPGVNDCDPFQVQFITQPVWCRSMRPADVARVENHPEFPARIKLLIDAVAAEVDALSKLDVPPDVVLVVMTEKLEKQCRVGIAQHDREQREATDDEDDLEDVTEQVGGDGAEDGEEDEEEEKHARETEARSFRRGLKAACLDVLPTQLLWHRTLAGGRGIQDLATLAWNLTVALLYKARIVPWRLADVIEGACFVGISFFRPDEADAKTLQTSVAQAFTDRGEGFVLQGKTFQWDAKKQKEKAPHLKREDAQELLERVLKLYADQVHGSPRRLIIHKTSRFTEAERKGFEAALGGISEYALVTIGRRGIFSLRPGNKATLRGTAVDFGQKRGLIYTSGYVPFLRCYPGFRVPQPLEIMENWGSLPFREVAADLMRLTKLNWNTAAFNCVDPITLAFARRIGDILKMAKTDNPAMQYRYYM